MKRQTGCSVSGSRTSREATGWGPTRRSAIGARRATSLKLWRTSGDRPPSCRDMTALVGWAPRLSLTSSSTYCEARRRVAAHRARIGDRSAAGLAVRRRTRQRQTRGPPLIGRLFSPDEQRPGGAPVAVLTHALWREAFGGDRSAIGSTIRLNEATYTVVGVLPDWFQFPSWAGVYLPLSTILPTDRILAQRGFHADSRIVAKLKPAVSIKQAQAAMAAIQSRLATAYPAENRGWTRVEFVSLFEEELRFGAVKPVLVLLAAAVAAVLLLACANVARSEERRV